MSALILEIFKWSAFDMWWCTLRDCVNMAVVWPKTKLGFGSKLCPVSSEKSSLSLAVRTHRKRRESPAKKVLKLLCRLYSVSGSKWRLPNTFGAACDQRL